MDKPRRGPPWISLFQYKIEFRWKRIPVMILTFVSFFFLQQTWTKHSWMLVMSSTLKWKRIKVSSSNSSQRACYWSSYLYLALWETLWAFMSFDRWPQKDVNSQSISHKAKYIYGDQNHPLCDEFNELTLILFHLRVELITNVQECFANKFIQLEVNWRNSNFCLFLFFCSKHERNIFEC